MIYAHVGQGRKPILKKGFQILENLTWYIISTTTLDIQVQQYILDAGLVGFVLQKIDDYVVLEHRLHVRVDELQLKTIKQNQTSTTDILPIQICIWAEKGRLRVLVRVFLQDCSVRNEQNIDFVFKPVFCRAALPYPFEHRGSLVSTI